MREIRILLDRHAPEGRVCLTASNDFAAEHPQVVAMLVQGLDAQTLVQQMKKERFEEFDDALPLNEIALLIAPAARPVLQVRAVLRERLSGGFVGDNRALTHALAFATHAAYPPAECLSSFSRFCLPRGSIV